MPGKAPRQKGDREERAIVNLFQEQGIGAERIPLSGSAGGSFVGDITIPIMGHDRRFESKVRGNGFKQLYDWLAGHHGLFIRADRSERLVVVRASDYAELVRRAGGKP